MTKMLFVQVEAKITYSYGETNDNVEGVLALPIVLGGPVAMADSVATGSRSRLAGLGKRSQQAMERPSNGALIENHKEKMVKTLLKFGGVSPDE